MPTEDIASVADIVRVHGVEHADVAALVVGERTITYRRTPRPLEPGRQRSSGGGRGGSVTASRSSRRTAPNSSNVTYGLTKLGAVIVPVNWRLAAPEMLQIIEDAGAAVVVVGSEFFGHIEAIEDRLTKCSHDRRRRKSRPLGRVR